MINVLNSLKTKGRAVQRKWKLAQIGTDSMCMRMLSPGSLRHLVIHTMSDIAHSALKLK